MKRSSLSSLAALVAGVPAVFATEAPDDVFARRAERAPPSDSDSSMVVWQPKPAPTYSATPDTGWSQRTDKARAKAKAARKARKAQRMRAKGKR